MAKYKKKDERNTILLYRDRIEVLVDDIAETHTDEDLIYFGEIMLAWLKYALHDEETEQFSDRHARREYVNLVKMTDLARQSTHEKYLENTIKSNLPFATSEDDMRKRLEANGYEGIDVQQGIDRYRLKQEKDKAKQGVLSDGKKYPDQYPIGTPWDVVEADRKATNR